MIKSFACKDTEALFLLGRRVPRFQPFEKAAMRKLQQVHAATNLAFLRVPPGNALEQLSGDRKGQYCIRINDQWRLCFRWDGRDAQHVEIVDYH